jgi:hypothetical protein
VEDMCYERRRAEACVDESAHHALQYLLQSCSRRGGGEQWRTCATRDYEPRPVWTSLVVCVFITAVPITKLIARGGGEMEDMCNERLRAEAYVN